MKKHLFLLVLFFYAISSKAININTDDFLYYFQLGIHPLKIGASDIDFYYIDESPAPDEIQTKVDIKKSSLLYGLTFGGEIPIINDQLFGDVSLDLYFKQLFLYSLNGGVGYNIDFDKISIKPKLDMVIFGGSQLYLGHISNQTGYIQVDDTKYYGSSVKTKLRDNFWSIKPSLTAYLPINKSINILLNVGYSLPLSNNSEIVFQNDNVEEPNTTFERLSDDNVSFILDGEKTHKLPFNYGGFFAGVGITFKCEGLFQ